MNFEISNKIVKIEIFKKKFINKSFISYLNDKNINKFLSVRKKKQSQISAIRYFNQFAKIITKDGINYYLDNSIYGAHYNVAKEIFKDNPIFGVGIKNYRIESFSKKYDDLDHKENDKRGNTHPHQTHYEFLSETGLFGYSTFLTFIIVSFGLFLKNYKKDKNLYQLSGMIYVLVALIPLLPSGSFFSTYTSGLFWINYAVMAGYIKK